MENDDERKEPKSLAFQAHLAHFDALRTEINSLNQIQNQLINYAIAIVAGTLTLSTLGSPPVITQQPVAVLLVSMLMSAISWAFMEAELRIHDRGRYLEDTLRKKVQELIGYDNRFEFTVLKWESADISFPRLIVRGLTATGKFAIAYLPGVAAIFAFQILRSANVAPWTTLETALFWTAIVMAAIFPLSLLLNVAFVLGYYRTLRPEQTPKRRR